MRLPARGVGAPRRAGLRAWLVAGFVAVGAFASLAVLLVVLPTLESSVRSDRLNRRSGEILQQLSEASRSSDFQLGAFYAGVDDALQRLAIQLSGQVRLIDAQSGQVAAVAGPGQSYLPIRPGSEASVALLGGRARRVQRIGRLQVVFAAVPVIVDGRPVAALEAAVPVEGGASEVGVVRTRVFIAVAVVLGLAILGGFLLARALTRRIDGLAATAGALAGGNLSARAEEVSPRELGSLGDSLNTMAERLGGLVATTLGERDRARGLIGSLSEGVLAVTPQGEVILANDAARRHLGLPAAPDLRIDALPLPVAAAARRVLIGATREADEEVTMPDGVVLDLHAQPIAQRAGGVVVTLRDVTDERRLEQARRDLVANVSHELKTPLAAIRGFLELLEDGVDERRRREFLALMSTEAERLERLVEEQLELARLDAGGMRLDREDIDLGELAERVASSRQALAGRSGLELVPIPPRESVIAFADPARVEQILLILIDNALRHTPRGGQASVDSGADAAGVWARVADTGPGIPAEVQPFVFDRFYQADPSREGPGAGLGLAIARGLARAHGGSIELASRPGKGSAFTLRLPAPSRVPITEGGERPALIGGAVPGSPPGRRS